MDVKIFSGPTDIVALKAFRARLYLTHGDLVNQLLRAIDKPKERVVVLAEVEGKLVGVCLITPQRLVQVYVKRKYRGKKIGSELVKYAKKLKGGPSDAFTSWAGDHKEASSRFWCRNRITVVA